MAGEVMTMQSIRISVSENYVSIQVQNGATRETSGRSLPDVLAALPAEDRDTVAAFCAGLLDSLYIATADAPVVKGLKVVGR
jgi:hypothetical protein